MSKRTDSFGAGSAASAALTAVSTLLVSAFAAIVGVLIAREFGRTDETDGFFAAYGVYIVITLAAQSIRVAVLPTLARAGDERRLAGTAAGFGTALTVVAVPMLLIGEVAAQPLADLLTGSGSAAAEDACADALRWMIPAAVAHLYVGLAASALAALDDYVTAAVGYAAGSAAGLVLIVSQVDEHGIVAVSWGLALNGAVALLVPSVGLALRAAHARLPSGAVRPTGAPLTSRLGMFAIAASLPLALQLLYVICLPFAGTLGVGAVTSFGYAYLAAASLVTVTAFSIGLVSSVPLTRIGLGAGMVGRHVTSSSWIALLPIGATVGAFAVAGADIVERVLGGAYGGDVGDEVSRLVVVLAPWMVASVGVNVTFPLTFVAERLRALPVIAAAALAAQVLLAWIGAELFELDGLAVSLALSTLLVLAALLRQLAAVDTGLRGLAVAAVVVSVLTCAAFVPPALAVGGVAGALDRTRALRRRSSRSRAPVGSESRGRTCGRFASRQAVDLVVAARGLVPRVPRRAREPSLAQLLAPVVRLDHRCRHRFDVRRIEQHGRVSGDLGDRSDVRRRDRAPARHRLEHRQSEALVEARIHEAGGATVERCEVLGRDGAEVLDAFGERLEPLEPASGEHEAQLRARLAETRECLQQAGVVLVRPGPCGVQHDRLGLFVTEREHRMVDRERHDVHTRGIEVEQLDGSRAHELARDDDRCSASSGAVVGDAPERPARRAEELREIAVLRVVERDDSRRLRPRRGDGQRIVEHVELCDMGGHGLRPASRECHGRDPERAAPRNGWVLDLDGREPFGRVLGSRGHENGVVVGPDAPEPAQELPRVRLGSTEVAWRQRQEGDADAHPPQPTDASS